MNASRRFGQALLRIALHPRGASKSSGGTRCISAGSAAPAVAGEGVSGQLQAIPDFLPQEPPTPGPDALLLARYGLYSLESWKTAKALPQWSPYTESMRPSRSSFQEWKGVIQKHMEEKFTTQLSEVVVGRVVGEPLFFFPPKKSDALHADSVKRKRKKKMNKHKQRKLRRRTRHKNV